MAPGDPDLDAVAAAVADPVRRAVLERLRTGPLDAGDLAAAFPISRPAVSRHLRVLRAAGLVASTAAGRRRSYHLEPAGLRALERWLASFDAARSPLAGALEGLDALATEVQRTRRHGRTSPTSTTQERTA